MYLGHSLAVKTNHNTAELLISMFNVEVDLHRIERLVFDAYLEAPSRAPYLVCDLWAFGSISRLRKEHKSDRKDQECRDDESLKVEHFV